VGLSNQIFLFTNSFSQSWAELRFKSNATKDKPKVLKERAPVLSGTWWKARRGKLKIGLVVSSAWKLPWEVTIHTLPHLKSRSLLSVRSSHLPFKML